MASTDSFGKLFADDEFSKFLSAIEAGADLGAWSSVFENIRTRACRLIRHCYPSIEVAEDAAQSAIGTFLRRMRDREKAYTFDSPKKLLGLLMLIAHRKATDKFRETHRHQRLPDEDEIQVRVDRTELNPDARNKLLEFMTAELEKMLKRLEESLKTESHRAILPYWIAEELQNKRMTDAEIADKLGVSKSTVERAKRQIRRDWDPILVQARELILDRAFLPSLEDD